MNYVRICEGTVETAGRLIPADDDIYGYVKDHSKPYFRSLFQYNDEHYRNWQEKGTIRGIVDVETNRLAFDLDAEDNADEARRDALQLCTRLLTHGIPEDQIQICFSGNKGFSIEVEIDKRITVEEFKNINLALTDGLKTNDKKILNASRVFRVPQTRHEKSGLYKFPLTLAQLADPIEVIRDLAKDLNNLTEENQIKFNWTPVSLPESVYALRKASRAAPTTPAVVLDVSDVDFRNKPRGFSNCKFAILHGLFSSGERSNSLMALAATCRNQGYPKEITYNMLKGAARMQGLRTGKEPFSKNEIWNKIIEQVYSPLWRGGQYTCKSEPWLKDLCDSLGPYRCKHDEHELKVLEAQEMSELYRVYTENIEKNTIKTGIKALDNNVQLTVGMPVGLLGAPSSGKTSISLDILENTSQMGIDSTFFSMDMYGPLVYMKKIQRLTGMDSRAVHAKFKEDPAWLEDINKQIYERYKNVRFCLKSGLTVSQMRDVVNEQQERTGRKVKLVLVDYLECISGPYSDATANTAKVAGELKDMAIEMDVCLVVLVQPPKSAGDAREPLTSMRQVKGASMLEQSFRVILGIYREGFNPQNPNNDRFLTVSALKNTMGPLFTEDCAWDGVTGKISPLDFGGRNALTALREERAEEKKNNNSGGF